MFYFALHVFNEAGVFLSKNRNCGLNNRHFSDVLRIANCF